VLFICAALRGIDKLVENGGQTAWLRREVKSREDAGWRFLAMVQPEDLSISG